MNNKRTYIESIESKLIKDIKIKKYQIKMLNIYKKNKIKIEKDMKTTLANYANSEYV